MYNHLHIHRDRQLLTFKMLAMSVVMDMQMLAMAMTTEYSIHMLNCYLWL